MSLTHPVSAHWKHSTSKEYFLEHHEYVGEQGTVTHQPHHHTVLQAIQQHLLKNNSALYQSLGFKQKDLKPLKACLNAMGSESLTISIHGEKTKLKVEVAKGEP